MKRLDLLELAKSHWLAMKEFREERERCKRYTYGRQWDDRICVDGVWKSEEQYISEQGNIALKNNLIRRIVRNVLGVFRNQYVPPTASDLDLPDDLRTARLLEQLNINARSNMIDEMYARTMEEFLISGLAVHRKWYGTRDGCRGYWTDYVQPDYFIIDTSMRDFRGWDASVVGEIHDVDFTELVSTMAESPRDIERLRSIYREACGNSLSGLAARFGNERDALSFLTPTAPGRCRVIELWVRSPGGYYRCHDTSDGSLYRIPAEDYDRAVLEENERRRKECVACGGDPASVDLIKAYWGMEQKWHYYFLTPLGHVLRQGESPYPHGSHPYVFKAYPFIDGEIHSFVADLIDQQRYVNRLVTMFDWIMRASAKGVLLFPEGSLPDNVDMEDIAAEWSRFNGVIMFKPKPGIPLPQQVSGNATNIGITELLQIQLKMMEDVSGVNSALQGKLDSGAVSGTLYDQQTRHALTGLLDILQCFGSFIREGFKKEVALISADCLTDTKKHH
ncbi:MAG: hypothetical protein NC328_05945 [Muribaculum sp.]|nr:hypothetical protein [Muribaculum sp.]